MGIEPTQPAWKAGILPLNYARVAGTPRQPNTFPTETQKRVFDVRTGGNRIRTCEDISQRIYSPSQLAALVFPQLRQNFKLFILLAILTDGKIIAFYQSIKG